MSEYRRKTTHHFCDTELCMVLDTVTGETERAFAGRKSVGDIEEALDYIEARTASDLGSLGRLVIVKMQCVKQFKL